MLRPHLEGDFSKKLILQEQIYAHNYKETNGTGSATSRFLGRGTRTGLPNSWDRFTDWQGDIRKRKELKEKRVMQKERTTGNEMYSVSETVRVQNIKNKKWDMTGEISRVRTSDDGTILSYEVNIDGVITTRHRRYLSKIRNFDEVTVTTEEENSSGAQVEPGSSTQ